MLLSLKLHANQNVPNQPQYPCPERNFCHPIKITSKQIGELKFYTNKETMTNRLKNVQNKPRNIQSSLGICITNLEIYITSLDTGQKLLRTNIIIKIEKKKKERKRKTSFFFSIHLSSDKYRTNLENRTKTLLRTNISSK